MRNPPLRRQLFFWVTILLFLIIAPAFVFYTAGYRWNPKKGIIERNGTLILDTTPSDATIHLNGQLQEKGTPVTIKNLSPGTYQIDLSLEGHHAWSKTLQVLPERVTFANNIFLWLDAKPSLVLSKSYDFVSISPNGKYAIAIRQQESDSQLLFIQIPSGDEMVVDRGGRTQMISASEWNDDSSAVLLTREDGGHELIVRRNASKSIELPEGFFRWEKTMLIGALEKDRYVYDISNDSTRYDPFEQSVKDVFGDYQIISSTGTHILALIERGEHLRFELPSGNWRFAMKHDGYIYLRNGDDWISFDPGNEKTSSIRFKSESKLNPIDASKHAELLSRYGGELSLGKSGEPLSLLVRKSDRIISAIWHESGKYVLYATPHEIIALDLDDRDRRIETVLATFDDIEDFSYQKRELTVFGSIGDQRGMWKLAIE